MVEKANIVVSHSVVEAITSGSVVGNNGNLIPEATDVLHEMLHYLVNESQLPIKEEPEHIIITGITQTVLPALISAANYLNRPSLTWTDKWRLRNNLITIRNKINELRGVNQAVVDALLEALGWEDTDGNGFPDFVEDLMEERGIDFDELPTTAYPPEKCAEPIETLDPQSTATQMRVHALGVSLGRHISHMTEVYISPCDDYYIECECGYVFTNLQ